MFKQYEMELAGRTLRVDIDRVGKQANGAALIHYGDTVVLSTVTASKEPREGIDFFPLSVEYEEKMYSVGKIPGGFNKREGKASENAVLTSRVIDRPMRPLFPKDLRNDVTLDNLVLSVDPCARPELVAMIGSALVTSISDIPFDGPCATTQMGLINGEFIVNPSQEQNAVSDLQLTVASTREKVIMIEAGANIVPEDKMLEAIFKCHEINQTVIAFIDKIVAEVGKPKFEYTSCAVPEAMFEDMKTVVTPEQMEVAVFTDDKQTREKAIDEIKAQFKERYAENEEWLGYVDDAVYQYQKKTVRKMILKDHKRPDGRAIDQIRPLAAEVDIIPRVHGSAMFTRGQTQICDIVTLAPLSEAQKVDGLDPFVTEKRYIHHYNFPAYSVGETKVSRGPGRREIGHGALAERALVPVLPSPEDFRITAIQMDIKIHGLTPAIIKEAIAKTRAARMYILNEVMLKAIEGPRPQVNEYAPKITSLQIDPEKIGEVIGQRGKTINQIIEDTGVKIDITDDGRVDICGTDKDGIDQAIKTIKLIVEPVEVGKTYEGEVVRIMSFGAFVQIAPNKDGMIHISKLLLLVSHADLLQVRQMMITSYLQIFRDLRTSSEIWTSR